MQEKKNNGVAKSRRLLRCIKWIASVFPVAFPRGQASACYKRIFLTLDSLWSCRREDRLSPHCGVRKYALLPGNLCALYLTIFA